MSRTIRMFIVAALLAFIALPASAKDWGLKEGSPDWRSAGPLAFGPDGILLVGDPTSATIFAIDTGDTSGNPSAVTLQVTDLAGTIAPMLGTTAENISVVDLAVNPLSGKAYLSVSRGRGPDARPVLMRVDSEGKLSEVSLKKVRFAQASLPNAPANEGTGRRNRRAQSITDLGYEDGRVIIAGLSNEEFASKLRTIPFPFQDADRGTSVEIFHGAHGGLETRSPVRTFVSYVINDEPHLLAAYTCTPLVKFPLSDLVPGKKVRGTTIAELGNRNRPLDMIVYQKDGQDYLLLANSSRGVMKITTQNIDKIEGITQRVTGGGTAGLTYDTIEELRGVEQLDRLNETHALLVVRSESGTLNLETIALP